jgi:GNAT superfamily N-acetyltransferase
VVYNGRRTRAGDVASIEIRLADKGDADSVAQLVFELFEELASPGDSGYQPHAVTRTARSLLKGGESVWAFLAEDDAHPIGVLMLNECASIYAGGRFGEITELYVTPAFRALGVGKRLVEVAAGVRPPTRMVATRGRRTRASEVGAGRELLPAHRILGSRPSVEARVGTLRQLGRLAACRPWSHRRAPRVLTLKVRR